MKRTKLGAKTFEEALAKARQVKMSSVKAARKRVVKKKLPSISLLKKKLWKLVSIKIRQRDKYTCFTSGVQVSGSNAHCGHGIPNSVGGALLRYHPYNLHCQSYVENIHHSGNGGIYYRNQVLKYGQDKVNKLYELKNYTIKADRYFYNNLIDMYDEFELYEGEIVKFLEKYI